MTGATLTGVGPEFMLLYATVATMPQTATPTRLAIIFFCCDFFWPKLFRDVNVTKKLV
jgi:hypothetical protein